MSLIVEDIELDKDTPKSRHYNWEKSKTLYQIAKYGSITSAASHLNISQSALSRQINILEQHLEFNIFTRHTHGVKLTRKGGQLCTAAKNYYHEIKNIIDRDHIMASGGKRLIRISATHADVACILNDLILDYQKQNSDIEIDFVESDQLIDIISNDVDIAIQPFDPRARDVQQEPLFTLEKGLYASNEYLEKYGEPKTVEDLERHQIVAYGQTELYPYADINWILQLGRTDGDTLKPTFTSNSPDHLIKAADKGIGIVASYAQIPSLRKANLRRILPLVGQKEKEYCFVYPNTFKKDKVILAIRDYLQKNLSG